MTATIDAVYENGALRPKKPLGLVEGAEVQLTINVSDEDHDPLDEVIGICTAGPEISLAELIRHPLDCARQRAAPVAGPCG